MNNYIKYDSDFRQYISIIFRFLIIVYGVFIVCIEENRLPLYVYIISAVAYPIIFLFLFAKEGYYSKARLLNDFVFIGIILYGKDLNSITNSIFLFFPIINSPNHSGNKRSNLVYLFTLTVILISDKQHFSYWYLLPVAVLFILSFFERIRFSLNLLTQDLMAIIDKYDVKNYQFGNTHKIYKELIEEISKSKIAKWFNVSKIICFIAKSNNELILYNSSEVISNYSLFLDENDIEKLRIGKVIKDGKISVDDLAYKSNLLKGIKIIQTNKKGDSKEHMYIFCLILKQNNSLIYILFHELILNFFTQIFVRIARLISMETALRQLRDEEVLKIKNKLAYVNNTLLAMHFIRNKLSPIQNAIKMTLTEDIVRKSIDVEKWKNIKTREFKISEAALLEINEKTNYILESDDNPFKIKETYQISFSKIIFAVRRIWLNHFSNDTIYFNVNIETIQNTFFNLNGEAIEIVFTDIITNANKYCGNTKNAKVIFSDLQDGIKIEFKNDVRAKTDLSELKKIVESFNSVEFSVINRKTHGLKIVKDFLDQMGVGYSMDLNNEIFTFSIVFKKERK